MSSVVMLPLIIKYQMLSRLSVKKGPALFSEQIFFRISFWRAFQSINLSSLNQNIEMASVGVTVSQHNVEMFLQVESCSKEEFFTICFISDIKNICLFECKVLHEIPNSITASTLYFLFGGGRLPTLIFFTRTLIMI